jgi:transposase
LLDVDFSAMPLMTLYRASDALLKPRDAIERQVFSRVAGLFGFDTTVTLYDLTNTYMEGNASANPKAKQGRSKEKRTDRPLVTLALVLDGSGFVRESRSFEGNVVEGDTLEQMLTALKVPKGALVVMDAGIAKEENLQWLRDNDYRYLAVSREKSRQFDPEQAVAIDNAAGETVRLQKVVDEDAGEARLYCHSEARERKEQAIAKRFADQFEAGLQKLHEGLSKPRCEKGVAKLWERIGRLKEKSHGLGQHYHLEIQADDSGEKAIAITWQQQPLADTLLTDPGIYCLRSNILAWDEETFWRTYIMLTDLEAVFRSLKSELGLRPGYHPSENRLDGHLFITVLAYQLVQIIRKRLAEKGLHARWHTLRNLLNGQQRVTATFRRADGLALHVRKATRAEPEQLKIYQALGLNPAPGGTKKMVV